MVRVEDGSLVYFAGNEPRVYASRGADFISLKRDCSQPVLVSADRRTPESNENCEWIWSVYRVGSTWHAMVHNEYHDTFASTCDPGNPSPGNPCWYNSVTHAVSTDGGHTFTKPLAPAHVIAPPPEVWTPPTQKPTQRFPTGYVGGPVVRHTDGYYYAIVNLHASTTAPTYDYVCLVRTDDFDDPSSWRAWDGSGFSLRMSSPYVTGVPGPVCPSLSHMTNYASLSYSTYLDRYVGLGNGFTYIGRRRVCGFYLQLSSDLIHWSHATLVVEATLRDCPADPGAPGVLEPVGVIFPTFIDHILLSAGSSLVVESNFNSKRDTPKFQELLNKNPARVLQIQCMAEGEILYQRYKQRWESGLRHPGHVDPETYQELRQQLLNGRLEPLNIRGEYFELDTTNFDRLDYSHILSRWGVSWQVMSEKRV